MKTITYKLDGDNYSQRNNQIVWPPVEQYPNSLYKCDWKVTCNVTALVNALDLAGWKFPQGKYTQPEDNLAYFILTNKEIDEIYKTQLPAMYQTYQNALNGNCTEYELKNMYAPIEILCLLAKGANLWLNSSKAVIFNEPKVHLDSNDFSYVIYENFIKKISPLVVSTNFGGFGHIVSIVGATYEADRFTTPIELLIDDPWGKVNLSTNTYPVGGGGSGKEVKIPWDYAMKHIKPLNSQTKNYFEFTSGVALV